MSAKFPRGGAGSFLAGSLYKTLWETERYLFLDMPYELRRVIARFRCSNHDLMIEKGRHTNIDREYRYCTLRFRRGILFIETELHFLLECNSYEELRIYMFNETWLIRRNKQIFNKIMSCSEKMYIYKVAYVLLKAFELRKMLIT